MVYYKIKLKVYSLLDPHKGDTAWDKIINIFIVTLILSNTIAVVLETVNSIFEEHHKTFIDFEIFSVTMFSIEYVLRLWTCTCNPKYAHPVTGRIKYLLTFGALIDLVAVLPFYLPLLIGFDFRFIRILRIVRFFRFFKLGRYMNASRIIGNVFRSKKEELILAMIITMLLILIASSVMYFVEHNAQPNKFSSIPETMWWSVATLTTVGYGDIYPITVLGKTLTAVISVLGIGMFALPAGILASGFSEELRKEKEIKVCPKCGERIE